MIFFFFVGGAVGTVFGRLAGLPSLCGSALILLAVLLVFALGMVFGSIQFNVIAAVAGIVLFIATAVLFRLLNRLEVSKEIGSYIDGMIGILLLLLFYIIVLRLLQVI